jgi:small nuclear ribonucleoprotein (snRNP)-like protein
MAYQITTFLTGYTGIVPNRQTDAPLAFAKNVYDHQLWIDTSFSKELQPISEQMNILITDVNSYAISANEAKNTAVLKGKISTEFFVPKSY